MKNSCPPTLPCNRDRRGAYLTFGDDKYYFNSPAERRHLERHFSSSKNKANTPEPTEIPVGLTHRREDAIPATRLIL
jgi:hypothetical protein